MIIEIFNKSRMNIASEVENIADESISTIHFWTYPKCDLPHYLFIFRNPEPLGVELKNDACYGLENMSYL